MIIQRHSRGPRAANGSGGRGQISMKPTAKRVSSFQGGTLKTRFIPILATVMAGSNQSPTPSGAFNATPSLRSEAPQDFQTLWNLQVSPMDQMEQNELQVEQSKVEPRPVVTGVVQRDLKPTRNGTVQIFVSTLIHTLGCRDCSDQGCQKMRLVLGHFLTCQKTGASSPCLLCAQLIDIVTEHAQHPHPENYACPIPMCDALRGSPRLGGKANPTIRSGTARPALQSGRRELMSVGSG